MHSIRLLLDRPGIRYLLVGGAVYVFEIGVIIVAERAGASAPWAVAISFVLGTLVSFVLQKFVTFGDKRLHRKILLPQIIATALLIVWNLSFSVALTAILADTLPATVTRTIALLCTTIWNFYLYKTKIFNQATQPIG